MLCLTGVASPPSHPPLPKKPSLAPKPKGLAVTSPRNTLIEGDSIESITSTSSSDTITNDDSSPVTPEIQTSNPEASKPKGSPSRPTPRPRKTIKANGTPGEVAPSPRPRVLPKRNIPQQESDQSQPAEELSSSTLPNGNECNVVTNGTTSSPRERPNVPVRRLTLGSSDLTPKVCPRTSPKWSPVRAPLHRSSSSTSDYSASSSSVTDGESDTQQSFVSSDTKGAEQNDSSTGTKIETENRDANTSVPTHRPKPHISPKKPSLAMLSKRNTMCSIDSASFDKDNEKLRSENGKKATPQRPTFPPKRLSVIPVPQGSPSKPTVKSKPPAQQSTKVPKEDPPQVNGNKTEELSEVVPSSGEPSNNNKDITEKHSTLKSTTYEPTSPVSSGTKINQPVEEPKAPPILPRKTIPRNPIAPPRRAKSMSESDPNCELNTDVIRSDESNIETSCQQKSLERHTKLQSEGGERNGGKIGDDSDNSNNERSTFKRNRRAVKSCDQLAFDSMKSPKDKQKVSNGEVQQKPKPPRPPPPSKPQGLIHQASLQSPPPRPKPIRAKTIDMTSQAKEKVKTESSRTSKQNSPIRSKKLNQVICGSGETSEFRSSENEDPDTSDWEFIDLTPQQKQQIDKKGRGKIVTSESCEEVANQKPKNDAEIEPEHNDKLAPSKTSTNEQPDNVVSKIEETLIAKESEPETEKQPPGAAVSQLKLRKAQPPIPAQRNSIEGSPVHKPSSTSVLEERDVSSSNRNSQEISGRPLSQGSPVNGRSPHSSPKKTLKDRGRGSSPKRPSCAPPPPPPGAPKPNVATPLAQSPSPKIAPVQPKSPAPAELSQAPKPKRPAPPRPMAPPIKTSSNSRSNSPKPALPQNNDDGEEDQTNIYTEANAPNGEDGEESDTSSRDHDYELIPDPRRATLTRNTEPTSSSDGETRKDSSNRASGYIDDGLYLEPNQRGEEEELFENEYVYPEFMPANNIPVSPPTPPPNPELDLVFAPEHPPVEPKSRVSSVPRRKAPQKPKRTQSVRSDASYDSHSYFDMTGGSEHMER